MTQINKMTEQTQPKRSILRRVSRLIPGWGLHDYKTSGDFKRELKVDPILAESKECLHLVNVGVMIIATAGYIMASTLTHSYNPQRWSEIIRNDAAQAQAQREEYKKAYDALSNQLFGTNGLADIDRDGRVSFIEKMEALDRAECVSYGPQIRVAYPTTNDLQKAIDSYKTGAQTQ